MVYIHLLCSASAVCDSAVFLLFYEELYNVHGQAKAGGKKLPLASLTVSPAGLRIVNMASEAVISDLDIYRYVDYIVTSEHAAVILFSVEAINADCLCLR